MFRQGNLDSYFKPLSQKPNVIHLHDPYTLQCGYCDKKFKSTQGMTQHVRFHKEKNHKRIRYAKLGQSRFESPQVVVDVEALETPPRVTKGLEAGVRAKK